MVEEKELFDPEILKACVRAHASGALTLKTSTASNDVPTSPPAGQDDHDPLPTSSPLVSPALGAKRLKGTYAKKKEPKK